MEERVEYIEHKGKLKAIYKGFKYHYRERGSSGYFVRKTGSREEYLHKVLYEKPNKSLFCKDGNLANLDKSNWGYKPAIIYNGKKWTKHRNYYERGGVSLHRAVWVDHYGTIKKGYHIHHKDFNPANNDISNLEMLSPKEHHKKHWEEQYEERAEAGRKNLCKARASQGMADWYRSDRFKELCNKNKEYIKPSYRDATCEVCGKAFKTVRGRTCGQNCRLKLYRRDKLGLDGSVEYDYRKRSYVQR